MECPECKTLAYAASQAQLQLLCHVRNWGFREVPRREMLWDVAKKSMDRVQGHRFECNCSNLDDRSLRM
jgi:hypothetical protein